MCKKIMRRERAKKSTQEIQIQIWVLESQESQIPQKGHLNKTWAKTKPHTQPRKHRKLHPPQY